MCLRLGHLTLKFCLSERCPFLKFQLSLANFFHLTSLHFWFGLSGTVAAPQTKLAWMKKKQSQDLSSDEECSRTAAVKMGRKMKGTHLQKALLGGCEGIPRRRRRKKKRHKQVSETVVSEVVPSSNGSDKLLNCSGILDTKAHMFQQPHESSSPRVKRVEWTPGGDTVVQEDLSAETKISKQDEKKTSKRRKKMKASPLCIPKKHKASSRKTGQKDEQSSNQSDLEETSSSAAERAQHEQLTPSELDVLQPAPYCGLEQCDSKTASPLIAAQFVKESKKRRVKNPKNSLKTKTNISACSSPASDGDNQLQTMKDIAMETSIMTQRRVNCSSRARRQLQVCTGSLCV